MLRTLISLAILSILFGSPVHAAETHPFGVHDMWAMKRVSDPQVFVQGHEEDGPDPLKRVDLK